MGKYIRKFSALQQKPAELQGEVLDNPELKPRREWAKKFFLTSGKKSANVSLA
jgi:hypothetical protein